MKFAKNIVYSAYSGRLFCTLDDLYAIYNYLTGENLFTHQLPKAADVCKPYLETQFPWLKDIVALKENATKDDIDSFFHKLNTEYVGEVDVEPIPREAWENATKGVFGDLLEIRNSGRQGGLG